MTGRKRKLLENDVEIVSFIEYLKDERKCSERTVESYLDDVLDFAVFLDDQKLDRHDLTKSDVRLYLSTLRNRGLENTSTRRKISALRHFYHFLVERKGYKRNPFEIIASPRKKKRLPEFLSHEEMTEFLDNNKKRTDDMAIRDQAVLELLFATGLRASEIISLKLNQISMDEKEIRLIGKGNKERIVHFNDASKEALSLYLTKKRRILVLEKKEDDGTVFLNRKGNPLTKKSLEYLVTDSAKKANFPLKVYPHMFRHSFATELVNNGADLRVVQELMGHASVSTTAIYADVSYADLKKTYDRCFPSLLEKEDRQMAVIFDFNGTMFFDEDKHVLSWRAFAKNEFGVDIKDEDFPKHIHGFNNKEILSFLSGRTFSDVEVLEYATRKELYYQKICEDDKKNLHLVNGLPAFLDLLKEKNIPIAICTASMKPNVDWYIKTFSLLKWFDEENIIYDDGTLKKGKPDPEIYLRAFKRLGVDPKDCIVFEDAQSGIKSAYAAGCKEVVAITSEDRRYRIKDLPGISYFIEDYRKLPSSLLYELGLIK